MINEKNVAYQYGYNKDILQTKQSAKPTNVIWSDEIAQMLKIRKITLYKTKDNTYVKTQNKTIMDFA